MAKKLNQAFIRQKYHSELRLYRKYHKHPVNWWIHFIAVPVEWSSWLIILSSFKCQWIVATITAIYYLYLDSELSKCAALAQFAFAFVASKVYAYFDNYFHAILFAIILQLVSWTLQIGIGHKLIEKNDPSMVGEELTLNSIVLSPILAWDYITKC